MAKRHPVIPAMRSQPVRLPDFAGPRIGALGKELGQSQRTVADRIVQRHVLAPCTPQYFMAAKVSGGTVIRTTASACQ